MKRMHIHVGVDKLEQSVEFYSALFGSPPTKIKDDYAKWMLDDPRINFAISTRADVGIDHLGIQVDQAQELDGIKTRLTEADMTLFDEGQAVCCYAESDKAWVTDPSGIAWESFQTMQDAELFGAHQRSDDGACCVPTQQTETPSGCCG